MVYPVSNQSIPASNTFQPGGSAESIALKKPADDKQADSTKAAGTETARSQSSETRNNGQIEKSRSYDAAANDRSEDSGRVSASSSRGTNLNITV